jgi:methanogenic corrinoid protein MtbC1
MTKNFNNEFLEYLIKGNRKKCTDYIQNCILEELSLLQIYEWVLKQTLYEIGELWEYNKISVATEHLASAVVESLLGDLYEKIITNKNNGKKVIVSCVEHEPHQIGARMVADVFEMNDWDVYFLGANTPTKDIIELANIYNPNILAISTSLYFHIPILLKMLKEIRDLFPDLKVLIGGQALNNGISNDLPLFPNIHYLPDLFELESFLKRIN